jgi:hypothetical protein
MEKKEQMKKLNLRLRHLVMREPVAVLDTISYLLLPSAHVTLAHTGAPQGFARFP